MQGQQELALGVYDGFSGFVTQPVQGWKEGGSTGMYKGIGERNRRHLSEAARWSVAARITSSSAIADRVASVVRLTFKDICEEIQKKYGRTVDAYIRAMLIMQGYNEARDLRAEERVSISRAVEGGGSQNRQKEEMKVDAMLPSGGAETPGAMLVFEHQAAFISPKRGKTPSTDVRGLKNPVAKVICYFRLYPL